MRDKGILMVRFLIFVIGLLIMACGLDLMIVAHFGATPWDVLHVGLNQHFGLTIGRWSIIVGFFVLAISSVLMRKWPKLGAYLNMLLVGIFMDMLFHLPFMMMPVSILGKILMFVAGVIINGIGMGVYISAQLGAGPRDSFMLVFTKLTGWKVSHVRRLMEVIVLLIGWSLGGPVYWGTIIFSVSIGTIVGIALPKCQLLTDTIIEKLRNKKWNKDINRGASL
ncbi:YitT family protein [Bacillus sp. FJAT-49736]|uniref:YczE/YyaS/YitT family protein n=1 Tax=Bacillus sp. FJAT-49736 TaxID=2833582 RepID=UPI001BC8DFE6|nr:YitT family protein [Bacillus sp. FJAT-49736]MBS4173648.1 YitT family protein [Bacillus sp. FJAT-49736]